MSYSSLWGIDRGYVGEEIEDYENSWLFTPIIYKILPRKYIPTEIALGHGHEKAIIGIYGNEVWGKTNDKINDSDNMPDKICWELANQNIFFTKDKKIVAEGIRKFLDQNKKYAEDSIGEGCMERFHEIAADIEDLDESEYPYFAFKNTSCDDSVENWFYTGEYDESGECIKSSLAECTKYCAEFVVIRDGRIDDFIGNKDFCYVKQNARTPINVYVYTKDDSNLELAQNIGKFLFFRGCESSSMEDAKLVVSVGGDGAFLDAASLFPNADIIGINKGTLGYLAEVEEKNFTQALDFYLSGNYELQKRMRLSCSHSAAKGESALNDIAIIKKDSSILGLEVYVNGKKAVQYLADGVIVSTPTGSTGYAFSCGAPVVDPSSDMILITPIAPHSIMNRSICVSSDAKVDIKLVRAREDGICRVKLDGKDRGVIHEGDCISIYKSETCTNMIRVPGSVGYIERIMQKMGQI